MIEAVGGEEGGREERVTYVRRKGGRQWYKHTYKTHHLVHVCK